MAGAMTMHAAGNDVHLHLHVEQAFQIASGLHNEGRLREADRLYQFILAVMPAHFDSLFRLGTLRVRANQMENAVQLFRRAVAANPRSVDAFCVLGLALSTLGYNKESLACYREALSINPHHANTLNAIGTALYGGGQTAEAIAHLEHATTVTPDFAPAHFTLANILQDVGRNGEAITHYKKVLALAPKNYAAYNNFATVLQKNGHYDSAIALYKHALTINPEFTDACYNLGTVYLALDRNEDAIAQSEKALRLDPSRALAHNNIGIALQNLGRIDEASGAYERALQIAPRHGATHLNLAYLRRFTPSDPRLATLEKLAEDADALDTDSQIAVQFALGRAFADLGQHQRSFRHLRDGNALKRAQLSYNENEMLGLFGRIRRVFTLELMRQKSGGGDPSEAPVFVVGMPRSGTTLLEQILASHSQVHGAGEIETFYQALVKLSHHNGATVAFPDMVPAMSAEALHELGSSYVSLIRSAAPAAQRIVNKMPLNFKYVGLIHLALPNARIIHVRRDPLDTCFSCFSLLFSGDQSFTYDQGELARYYLGYAALMEHWRSVLPEGVMIEVQYEDLVADLRGQAGTVVASCGLPWEDACLAFHQTDRPVKTASSVQVREPLYRTSIGRWRPYEHLLQPLIQALNAAAPHQTSTVQIGSSMLKTLIPVTGE
jgi:tetratricopeptide (TPR) repeat protein